MKNPTKITPLDVRRKLGKNAYTIAIISVPKVKPINKRFHFVFFAYTPNNNIDDSHIAI